MSKLIYCLIVTLCVLSVLLLALSVLYVGEATDGNAPTFIFIFPIILFLSYLAGRQDLRFALLTLASVAIATGYCLSAISPIDPIAARLMQGFELPGAIYGGLVIGGMIGIRKHKAPR